MIFFLKASKIEKGTQLYRRDDNSRIPQGKQDTATTSNFGVSMATLNNADITRR